MFIQNSANAVVTYANCPTLAPLPVVNFMPTAMLPIITAENAFNVGMNVTIKNAVTMATQIQAKAVFDAFNSINISNIETNQALQQQRIEIKRQFQNIRLAYEQELKQKTLIATQSAFPHNSNDSDDVSTDSPYYQFMSQICTASKIQDKMSSSKKENEINSKVFRRAQKINEQILSPVDNNIKSKIIVDQHYDMFCSDDDFSKKLCDNQSSIPNGDIDATVFLYPSGLKESQSTDYYTLYTYSPVESLASYQFINNITGTIFLPAPSWSEIKSNNYIKSNQYYKQLTAINAIASNALLFISKQREPVNNSGTPMSKLDAINYLIEQSKNPVKINTTKSSNKNGKLTVIQQNLAIQQTLRLLILQQKDIMRQLKAGHVALQTSLE
jgi:hypothetical protein